MDMHRHKCIVYVHLHMYIQCYNHVYIHVSFFISPNPVIKDYSYLSHQIHSDM